MVAPLLLFTVREPRRERQTVAEPLVTSEDAPGSDKVGRRAATVAVWLGALLLIGAGVAAAIGAAWTAPAFGGGLLLVIGLSLAVAKQAASVVIPKPSFWLLALGAASSSVCGYGVAGWLPLFFMRSFDLTLAQTSWYYSGIALIGGLAGIWAVSCTHLTLPTKRIV